MYNVKPWAIDFFSLDVEGMELDVLDGLGLKHYRPKYILTEVTNLSKTAPDEIHSFMANNNYQSTVKRLGIPDEFINHGTQAELHHDCNYDANAIVRTVHEILAEKSVSKVS